MKVRCPHGIEIRDGFEWWECPACVRKAGWTRQDVDDAKRRSPNYQAFAFESMPSETTATAKDSKGKSPLETVATVVGAGLLAVTVLGVVGWLSSKFDEE